MKTLIAFVIAIATLASAGSAFAAPAKNFAPHKSVASGHVARKNLVIQRRCMWPRIHVRWEWVKLRYAGYRKIKYLGTKTFWPRCAKFLYFSACKGTYRYKVIVRYIRFQRYVIVLNKGYCFGYRRPLALRK